MQYGRDVGQNSQAALERLDKDKQQYIRISRDERKKVERNILEKKITPKYFLNLSREIIS